jgi:hypothetical protein
MPTLVRGFIINDGEQIAATRTSAQVDWSSRIQDSILGEWGVNEWSEETRGDREIEKNRQNTTERESKTRRGKGARESQR